MSESLPLTGERTVPGVPSENYWFQRHVAAYRFAAARVRGIVLDAGCGEGYGSEILAGTGDRVVALDVDAPTLDHVRSKYGRQLLVRGDLTTPPFATGSLDGIVALQVLEHLADADAFVARCTRVLRPGGVLVLSTPNVATFPGGLNPFHTHEYESAELAELLDGHFPEIRLSGIAHGPKLRWIERVTGEPLQDRLVRGPYPDLPPALRALLRTVGPGSFRHVPDPARALDLLAVCRNTTSGA